MNPIKTVAEQIKLDMEKQNILKEGGLGIYSLELKGEQMPKDVLKEAVLTGREVNHPIGNAKGYELISLPEEFLHRPWHYAKEFIDYKAEENKVYMIILGLEREERIVTYEDKPTGKFKVNDNIQKGQKKWITHYVVYKDEPIVNQNGEQLFDENGDLLTRRIQLELFATKGEAVKFARDYGNQHKTSVYIELEKRLDNASSRIADLEPIMDRRPNYHKIKTNTYMLFGKGTITETEEEEVKQFEQEQEETVNA